MKIYGFGSYDFIPDGYWFHVAETWMPVPSVEPTILNRVGAYATFGPPVIGEQVIPGGFGYTGALAAETAFLNLFKRLDVANPTPRQLRAQRNDGVNVTILAMLRIPQVGGDEVNVRPATFITVDPFWLAQGYVTGSGGFS